MSKIPYSFSAPVPRYFQDSGLFNCEKTFKYVTWAFSRCAVYERKIIIDGKEIVLEPFEFVSGRLTSAAECFLTENAFRNQQKSLIDAGFLKRSNNSITNRFSCYIWVTERFSEIDNQLTLKLTNRITNSITDKTFDEITNNNDIVNDLKSGTCNENVFKINQPNFPEKDYQINQLNNHNLRSDRSLIAKKEAIKKKEQTAPPLFSQIAKSPKSPLFQNGKKEKAETLQVYFESKCVNATQKDFEIWLSKFEESFVVDTIHMLIERNKTYSSWPKSIQDALTNGYLTEHKNVTENATFAIQFKNENNWGDLKLLKKYCSNDITGNDYQYKLPPESFRNDLKRAFFQSQQMHG